MAVDVKICGLKTRDGLDAAVTAGARFVGFVFFRRSPRYIAPVEAGALAPTVPSHVWRVGLVVDADDSGLAEVVAKAHVTVLQLHGAESPERVADIRARFGVPVIKAIALGAPADLDRARAYEAVADWLLFDAPPPLRATRPGGNAAAFDWTLLHARAWACPWILAGGLTAANVAAAVAATGASTVDVSSGVEREPGVKSPALISAFLEAAARAGRG